MENICAIITEYNPFHKGHEYNIAEAKKRTGCNRVIVLMSGPFVQRGEPAISDKWSRANMALLGGADIVIELPTIYACSSADWFAYGALQIVKHLGCVTHLAFGGETDDTEKLVELAKVLANEPEELSELIKDNLWMGVSHPKAVSKSVHSLLGAEYSKILETPNNTLALMYIKAIIDLNLDIKPVAVKRIGSDYNDTEITSTYASATAIRNAIYADEDFKDNVPNYTYDIFTQLQKDGKAPIDIELWHKMVMYSIIKSGLNGIKELPDMSEGLDNKLYKEAVSGDYNSMLTNSKSKRYPMARIKRALLHSALSISAKDMADIRSSNETFINILGVKKDSLDMLSHISRNATMPIIANPGKDAPDNNMWRINTRAQDIYSLLSRNKDDRVGAKDYTRRMLIVE